MIARDDLRTVAIVAHVDHGKTTLVDALFRQSGYYRANQQVTERALDRGDQERERGITILAKTTSVVFGKTTLQLVDTPGHADFGGEVERTLRMVDGVLLLVDAAEGVLPQTRFVLRKALDLGLAPVVAINKIDRADARPQEVLNEIYDLFIDLDADEAQLEFPVLYTEARSGRATRTLEEPGESLQPLVEALIESVPAPPDRSTRPFLMQVNTLSYDEYVGRLIIGRVLQGQVVPNQAVRLLGDAGASRDARVVNLFRFRGTEREPLASARSGEIVALAGIDAVSIGETVCDPQVTAPLPRIRVDEPTVTMVFQVDDGPLVGKSGAKYLTSRHLRERLQKEAFANVAIRLEPGETPEEMRVLGRGELQLAVLIEQLRRDKYALCVRPPEVVVRQGAEGKQEPVERLVVDVPMAHLGAVNEVLGPRKAQLADQRTEGERLRGEYIIPTRGLFGLRSALLTATRGTAVIHSVFEGWTDYAGPIPKRTQGALVADRHGSTTPYALFHLQARGVLFLPPGIEVYEGMIVGEHSRDNDLDVNVVREKKLTNVRAAGKDENTVVSPPRVMSLEQSLEWIRDDEMVEVTPAAIRLRKRMLAANRR